MDVLITIPGSESSGSSVHSDGSWTDVESSDDSGSKTPTNNFAQMFDKSQNNLSSGDGLNLTDIDVDGPEMRHKYEAFRKTNSTHGMDFEFNNYMENNCMFMDWESGRSLAKKNTGAGDASSKTLDPDQLDYPTDSDSCSNSSESFYSDDDSPTWVNSIITSFSSVVNFLRTSFFKIYTRIRNYN